MKSMYYDKNRSFCNGFFRKEDLSDSDIYPIADTNNITVQKELQRLEELYNYSFGIAYGSKFYDMVVDPIEGGEDGYFPYARVFAANNLDGAAAVVVHNGKFVLLEQYRHSIRRSQYCIPRGFLKVGETPKRGIISELNEELNVKLTREPKPLGTVIADSGMTKINTHIFVVEVSSFEANTETEGIIGSVEVPIEEFDEWIIKNKEDDSFTLSAYALYRIRNDYNHG